VFYRALPSGPFYGFNRPGVEPSEAIIENWWRQGMMGGAKAHYDGIVAFSQTDFTEDLKKISAPVLVMHGDDDQIVPYADAGPLSAKLVQNGTLKTARDRGPGSMGGRLGGTRRRDSANHHSRCRDSDHQGSSHDHPSSALQVVVTGVVPALA
jgi:hypothetical protein